MTEWIRNGVCKRECFANYEGLCRALIEIPEKGECPFRRTDITMRKQNLDMQLYNSTKSLNNG